MHNELPGTNYSIPPDGVIPQEGPELGLGGNPHLIMHMVKEVYDKKVTALMRCPRCQEAKWAIEEERDLYQCGYCGQRVKWSFVLKTGPEYPKGKYSRP